VIETGSSQRNVKKIPPSWPAIAATLLVAAMGQAGQSSGEKIQARCAPQLDRLTQIYSLGEPYLLSVEVYNPTDTPVEGTSVIWRVSSWYGTETEQSQPIALPPKKVVKVPITYQPTKLGWYEIDAQVKRSDGQTVAGYTRSFAVDMPTKSRGSHFRYGLCSHTWRKPADEYAKEMALIDRLGVDIVRDGPLDWNVSEPRQGEWNFEMADRFLDDLARIGVELQAIFSDTPKWARTGNPDSPDASSWARVTPREDAIVEFAQTISKRYKSRVRYWEYFNEPDISWRSPPQQYAATWNAAATAIRESNPEAMPMNGGFAMVRRQPNPRFVDDVVPILNTAQWKVFAYHDYNTFENMVDRYRKAVRPVYDKARLDIPIWVNEGGFNMLLPGGGERTQAAELAKKYIAAPWLGLHAYLWYDLRDDGVEPENKEHHFGLVKSNFQPKPSYSAYQTVIRELASAKYVGSLQDKAPANVSGFLYYEAESDSATIVAAWRDGKNSAPFWIAAESDAKLKAARDLMGNPIASGRLKSGSVVEIGPEPVYFQFAGTGGITALRPLLETPASIILAPRGATTVRFILYNPTDEELHPVMELTSPDMPGIVWELSPCRPTITPGASLTIMAKASLAEGAHIQTSGNQQPKARITLKYDDSDFAAASQVSCRIAGGVPVLPPFTSLPPVLTSANATAIKLDTRDAIYNLFSAEINEVNQWHGPGDLSATAFLAADENYLHITVKVEDDIQTYPSSGPNLSERDSLEISLRSPEDPENPTELGIALNGAQKAMGWVFRRNGLSSLVAGNLTQENVPFTVQREGNLTTYCLSLPWKAIGSQKPPAQGFHLNLYVNDADRSGARKQWLRLVGDASGQRKEEFYRPFVCQ